MHQEHADPQVLHICQDLSKVLLGADDYRIADGPVARERGEVAVDVGLDAFPPSRPHLAQPQLETGKIREDVVLRGAAAIDCRLVPVAPQHGQTRAVAGEPGEKPEQACIIPDDGVTLAGTVNGHSAISKHIARVYE
jgi:hypothetical protein